MCLESKGTSLYFDTWSLTLEDMDTLPHITLSSPREWNYHTIKFPKYKYSEKGKIEKGSLLGIISFLGDFKATMINDNKNNVFSLESLNK